MSIDHSIDIVSFVVTESPNVSNITNASVSATGLIMFFFKLTSFFKTV